MRQLFVFISCFIIWLLLTFPLEYTHGKLTAVKIDELIAGLCVAVIVSFVLREPEKEMRVSLLFSPSTWFWMLVYIFVLAYYIIKANIDVAYRVIHPALPISPGIVRIKTKLKSDMARMFLCNSITLTPGTLTVNLLEDGTIYVHWINVKTLDDKEASKEIIGRFEFFISKIFKEG